MVVFKKNDRRKIDRQNFNLKNKIKQKALSFTFKIEEFVLTYKTFAELGFLM